MFKLDRPNKLDEKHEAHEKQRRFKDRDRKIRKLHASRKESIKKQRRSRND